MDHRAKFRQWNGIGRIVGTAGAGLMAVADAVGNIGIELCMIFDDRATSSNFRLPAQKTAIYERD